MAKRQKRYADLKAITQYTSEITGKKANIVYRDGRVSFVEILDVQDGKIFTRNMRLAKSVISLSEVSEIIIDSKA